jgi:hypothetical protein
MRRIFANNAIMVGAACVFGAIGIFMSICTRNFMWFERFGSMIACVGILLLNRPNIVGQDILPDVEMAETGLSSHDAEHYRRVNEPIPPAVVEDQKSRNAVGSFGPWIIIIGTIIWGFANLLNVVFGFSPQ